MKLKRNSPRSSDTCIATAPVPSFVSSARAPGKTPPSASVTTPPNVAVVRWANAIFTVDRNTTTVTNTRTTIGICPPSY